MVSQSYKNKRASILGYPVDIVSFEEACSIACSAITGNQLFHIVTLNPEMIIQAQKNEKLSHSISNSDLIIPDGAGLILALALNGIKLSDTVPGIELAENCLDYCCKNNIPVAFLGAEEKVLEDMLKAFSTKYKDLNIAYVHNGFYNKEEEAKIAKEISSSNARLILIALGVPGQELWINKYRHLFSEGCLIGVGGSFDVWSGNVKRAPVIFRKLKLEWFYRLISDPRRARRIFSALPYFVVQVLWKKLRT
jgi:N-acetylglucosaminyldiphosphoundecaprenol N-acetyl-beta-D-mannosaminyltransferase